MNRHTRTDPSCRLHHPPRTRLGRWLFDRRRGVFCQPCGVERRIDR
ncbi:hypothetical protein SEA_THIMANN_76 [Gordonia phage Thimann]|nr:hypothetical protein SEA_THIMANN_76 [Gordonia phage Thimann]